MKTMILIDAHAHLTAGDFEADREAVLQHALEAGVEAIRNLQQAEEMEARICRHRDRLRREKTRCLHL
jgi:Tat protein secretion system quality control protein TatD with DNase activity